MTLALLLALCGNLCFSFASTRFTHFTRKTNALWMNCLKTLVALIANSIAVLAMQSFSGVTITHALLLLTSGFVGLFLGDLFMLESMKEIGAARMLMMFGLTPFLTGIGSYFVFGSSLSWSIWVGVLFMLGCLFLLALEKYKSSGHWHWRGVSFGFIAVTLDSMGLLFTKYCFTHSTEILTTQVNLIRAAGACLGFAFVHLFIRKIPIIDVLKTWNWKERSDVIGASFLGTVLSLTFYLTAVSRGHLSVISSLSGTGPLFAEIIESHQRRKWPHPFWWAAFTCFAIGMYFFTS